jgi:hypothetical protein
MSTARMARIGTQDGEAARQRRDAAKRQEWRGADLTVIAAIELMQEASVCAGWLPSAATHVR